MAQYNFEKWTCTLTESGIDMLPDKVICMCEGAVIFRKPDGLFFLYDRDGFGELKTALLKEAGSLPVVRYILSKCLEVADAAGLAQILWAALEQDSPTHMSVPEVKLELAPSFITVNNYKSNNQFISIKVSRR